MDWFSRANGDDEEVSIFDNPGMSKELVDRLRAFESLPDLLRYLLDEKPLELNFGGEHYLDIREIQEHMSGLCLKLKIHGYDDRGERLQYLFSILSKKFRDKEEILKIIVQFLVSSSQRPTAVTHLDLKSEQYSSDPDDECGSDDDSARQKALLLKILSEEGEDTNVGGWNYSSDSELSDWSTDEESTEEISTNDIPPIVKIRHSSSFGEFSDVTTTAEDAKAAKEEVAAYWRLQKTTTEAYLKREIRRFHVLPLRSQPVISSLLVLQSRFGEFWEWKKFTKDKQELNVAFEEDVVREILWQFSVSYPESSPVFTPQWDVKSNLMVATLSKSSFTLTMKRFGQTLSKIQSLRKFANKALCRTEAGASTTLPPSKVLRNYAAGLLEFSRFIESHVCKLEQELNRTCRNIKDETDPACTTLIRVERSTSGLTSLVNLLYDIHSKSISCSSEGPTEEPWLYSLKLMSCLEMHLLLETKPDFYGLLFFQFSKCLQAFLDDTISTLYTMKWDEKYSLFVRDPIVRLNDSNFWSDCIKIRDYKPPLVSSGIVPLPCLDKFLPRVLNILKTCEVLDQLEEDFMQILCKSNLQVNDVIHEFCKEIFSMCLPTTTGVPSFERNESHTPEFNFLEHFSYIGLESSHAASAFRFLTSPKQASRFSNTPTTKKSFSFMEFLSFSTTPFLAHSVVLEKVLGTWFSPFTRCATDSIQKIFGDYKVLESLRVFQEVILTAREDFAKAIIEIASKRNRSEDYTYEDSLSRNPKFQKLLNECYPEGREIFSVDLKLDSTNDMNCSLITTPHFPLNLIVTAESVADYLFIGRQLHRIRKSLWHVSSLSMKDCAASDEVSISRLLMFRFCLINFCSSLRSFFTLKLFTKDFSHFAKSASYDEGLDSIRRVHEEYLDSIKTGMLRNPLIENIIIRKLVVMSDVLRKRWSMGTPQATMLVLEDTLKKCWQVVNDFENTKYRFDFNELSYHFGPPPSCL